MKYLKIVLAVAFVFTICTAFSSSPKTPKLVYAFGVSASFADTVVYYTDIQLLDSVTLTKNGFLPHRNQYSDQLSNFMELEMNKLHRTCMVYFSENKSKLEKEAAKLMSKYRKKQAMRLEKIDAEKFQFTKPQE